MKWKRFTIETTTQAEDFVCGMLTEIGVTGVEIQDRLPITEDEKRRMFIDILPELPPDDGVAYVSFYIEMEEDGSCASDAVLAEVRAGLSEMAAYVDVGAAAITEDETEEKDWINEWKAFFTPFTVDDVLIKPSWHEMDETEKAQYPLVIEIDPGTSFGTGMHETTQLVLRALRSYVTPATRLFDVGCGSGILSILALKLGASHAVCMDIDPAAVQATADNMAANGVDDGRYDTVCGNLLAEGAEGEAAGRQAGGSFDIVAANILADVIIPLAAVVGSHLKPGGLFITSGILDVKEKAVREALFANGFEIVETARQNDWVSVIGRKPSGI